MRGYSITCAAPTVQPVRRAARKTLLKTWLKHALAFAVAAPFGIMALSSTTAALELPKPAPAEQFLGPATVGENYKVKPVVRSDGVMRIFDVDTKYGDYSFDGIEFAKLRLHELNAIAALEKMSQSDAFGKALGQAALGPFKFGADLITKPADTVERSITGIGNMFERAGAGLSNSRADRDSFTDSLLGISDTQRELAVELDVDPYTDFPPLAQRLKQMAGAMASGGLPIKAGLSLVPGGIGIAVSSVATVSSAKDTLRDKTAAQLIVEVRGILLKLQIEPDVMERLLENRNYTPADLLIMARALRELGAADTNIFVEKAAGAGTRNYAFYFRRRAQILAAHAKSVGGVAAFISVAGQPINVLRDGRIIAAFTFDDVVWTDVQSRTFTAATAEIHRLRPGAVPVLATTGVVTPMAQAEITKLGWKIIKFKAQG